MAFEDKWGNSAWKVTKPLRVFQLIGIWENTQTYVGSSKMLANVYQEIELQEGDTILSFPGGIFVQRKNTQDAFPIAKRVSDKHPFEKTYGWNIPFCEEWAGLGLEKLPTIPSYTIQNKQPLLATLPPTAKRFGRNIDYLIPL